MQLPAPAVVREVQIRFQGGFAGQECVLMAGDSETELVEIGHFYPKDRNSVQVSLPLKMLIPACMQTILAHFSVLLAHSYMKQLKQLRSISIFLTLNLP